MPNLYILSSDHKKIQKNKDTTTATANNNKAGRSTRSEKSRRPPRSRKKASPAVNTESGLSPVDSNSTSSDPPSATASATAGSGSRLDSGEIRQGMILIDGRLNIVPDHMSKTPAFMRSRYQTCHECYRRKEFCPGGAHLHSPCVTCAISNTTCEYRTDLDLQSMIVTWVLGRTDPPTVRSVWVKTTQRPRVGRANGSLIRGTQWFGKIMQDNDMLSGSFPYDQALQTLPPRAWGQDVWHLMDAMTQAEVNSALLAFEREVLSIYPVVPIAMVHEVVLWVFENKLVSDVPMAIMFLALTLGSRDENRCKGLFSRALFFARDVSNFRKDLHTNILAVLLGLCYGRFGNPWGLRFFLGIVAKAWKKAFVTETASPNGKMKQSVSKGSMGYAGVNPQQLVAGLSSLEWEVLKDLGHGPSLDVEGPVNPARTTEVHTRLRVLLIEIEHRDQRDACSLVELDRITRNPQDEHSWTWLWYWQVKAAMLLPTVVCFIDLDLLARHELILPVQHQNSARQLRLLTEKAIAGIDALLKCTMALATNRSIDSFGSVARQFDFVFITSKALDIPVVAVSIERARLVRALQATISSLDNIMCPSTVTQKMRRAVARELERQRSIADNIHGGPMKPATDSAPVCVAPHVPDSQKTDFPRLPEGTVAGRDGGHWCPRASSLGTQGGFVEAHAPPQGMPGRSRGPSLLHSMSVEIDQSLQTQQQQQQQQQPPQPPTIYSTTGGEFNDTQQPVSSMSSEYETQQQQDPRPFPLLGGLQPFDALTGGMLGMQQPEPMFSMPSAQFEIQQAGPILSMPNAEFDMHQPGPIFDVPNALFQQQSQQPGPLPGMMDEVDMLQYLPPEFMMPVMRMDNYQMPSTQTAGQPIEGSPSEDPPGDYLFSQNYTEADIRATAGMQGEL